MHQRGSRELFCDGHIGVVVKRVVMVLCGVDGAATCRDMGDNKFQYYVNGLGVTFLRAQCIFFGLSDCLAVFNLMHVADV